MGTSPNRLFAKNVDLFDSNRKASEAYRTSMIGNSLKQ